MTRLAAGDNER